MKAMTISERGGLMTLGFTGSRQGINSLQYVNLLARVAAAMPGEAVHGCCTGADEDFHDICRAAGKIWITGMPSDIVRFQSARVMADCDQLWRPRPPLVRNRAIVDSCAELLACPDGPEIQRSGTWSTVRYAWRSGKPVTIFRPDGSIDEKTHGRVVSCLPARTASGPATARSSPPATSATISGSCCRTRSSR